jgi:hypothetical protein
MFRPGKIAGLTIQGEDAQPEAFVAGGVVQNALKQTGGPSVIVGIQRLFRRAKSEKIAHAPPEEGISAPEKSGNTYDNDKT